MAQYAAAVDQGTTSTRFMVFDHGGQVVSVDQKEHEQIYPKPGWVEHDANEIWQSTQEVIRAGLDKVKASDIAAVGVTNQRETTVVWDRTNGRPVYNAIVWQDTRTDTICNELIADGGQDRFRVKTGLPIATYFSGPKIKWILENVDGIREKAEAGDVIFGNIDSWVIWQLTGGPDGGVHITAVTNASRTMMMSLETLDWDDLGLLSSAPEIEDLAKTVDDNGGVYFVPAFSGLFAPYWRGDARGVIAGLTRYVNKGHIARATLEATAWQTKEVVDAMNTDSGVDLTSLKVDGGMVQNELLMQFQADVLDVPVIRPTVAETTSLGAAYAAGLAVGFWSEIEDLRANWGKDKEWQPQMDPQAREKEYAYWKKAVTRTFDWVD